MAKVPKIAVPTFPVLGVGVGLVGLGLLALVGLVGYFFFRRELDYQWAVLKQKMEAEKRMRRVRIDILEGIKRAEEAGWITPFKPEAPLLVRLGVREPTPREAGLPTKEGMEELRRRLGPTYPVEPEMGRMLY